ncbi:MAG: isoaspartyl peptidase/L-asparaginase family protein, partial [Limisphaerales bacterium]
MFRFCSRNLLVVGLLVFLTAASSLPAHSQQKHPFGIVIHGGAGAPDRKEMTKEREAEYHTVLKEAIEAGHSILARGGTSLDAVTAAIIVLEDSPLFNAGRGAVLNTEGKIELDASIMDGKTTAAGAVAGVKETKNPILLARAVMEKTPHVMLAGDATDRFAREQKLTRVPNKYFETERRREAWERLKKKESKPSQRSSAVYDSETAGFGTVGAVALDQHGNLAAGTSTGGRINKMVGRVGDSPIIGAGTYANNETCAVSGTGHGEYFIRRVAGHTVSAQMEY